MRRAIAWTSGMVLGIVVAFSGPARAQSSVVPDAEGDMVKNGEPYLDVLEMELSIVGDVLTSRMQVAAPLPDEPPRLGGGRVMVWEPACIDLDQTVNPTGWPFGPDSPFECEIFVLFIGYEDGYHGLFVDRRPGASGGDPIIYDCSSSAGLDCDLDGDTITIRADVALWKEVPPQFVWRGGVLQVKHLGKKSIRTEIFDFGSDPPYSWLTWP